MDGRLFGNRRDWAIAAAYTLLALVPYAVLTGLAGVTLHPSYWAFVAGFGLLGVYLTRRGCWWALVLALAFEAVGTLAATADSVYLLPAAGLIAAGLLVALRGLLRRPTRL